MDKYLHKTLVLLLLFLSTGMVLNNEISRKMGDNLRKSMNWIYTLEEKLVNRVEEMNQIIMDLNEEVQSMKKQVILVKNEENEKKILLQQVRTKVDKIDSHLQLINQDVNPPVKTLKHRLDGPLPNSLVFERYHWRVNYESKQMSKRINETVIREDEFNSTLNTLKAEVGSLKQQLLEEDQAYESDNEIIYNHFYAQKYEPRIFDYTVYKWTIADVKRKVATEAFDLESEVFPLKGYSFQAKAKLQLYDNDTQIYISLSFQDNNGTHNPVEITVLPLVIFILRDVSEYKAQLEHRTRSINYLTNSLLDYNKFYYNTSISHKSWIIYKDYNINGAAEVLVLVEPPAVAQKLRSTDGVLLQCVTNYKHRLLLGKRRHVNYQQSSYFSTHANGYRVQVRMYLNGDGYLNGFGLSVRIAFLEGEFDSTLSSSFPHKTTVTLFNQRDLTNHLVKTFVSDIKKEKYYTIDIATHKQVEDDGYLLNDSLLYHVVIQPIEINQN